jgi:hypothetical protein
LAVALKITHFWSFSIALVRCLALSLIYESRTRFDVSLRHCQWILAVLYLWGKVNCLRKKEKTNMGMYEYTNIYRIFYDINACTFNNMFPFFLMLI